ncbi:hypothetical protein Taro_023262 [Colocasia esculenta]|uniref:CCR4-NOT transcription complex subunit 9 n=1 Tax=Colocasia esculenta TaxID=4460 RepID=A0A843VDZ7_COLES|nr:hypothetical protein [Colocasia esculenta]
MAETAIHGFSGNCHPFSPTHCWFMKRPLASGKIWFPPVGNACCPSCWVARLSSTGQAQSHWATITRVWRAGSDRADSGESVRIRGNPIRDSLDSVRFTWSCSVFSSRNHVFFPLQVDDTEVINFLLSTEIIPLCLRTMEMGSELSKTVATFIVQKILLDDVGLRYICATAERFFAVGRVLATMVNSLAEQPSTRLLKHIIRCYLRLTDNPRACEALKGCLPDMLKDGTFSHCLRVSTQTSVPGGCALHDDPTTRRWLQQLIHNMSGGGRVSVLPTGLEHMMAT